MQGPVSSTRFILVGIIALASVFITGCSKEEVQGPDAVIVNGNVKSTPVPPSNNGKGQIGNSTSPTSGGVNITDDGDDLGDKESTTKPRPH